MRGVSLRRWAWVTHPQEAVQFPHGHLLGSVHSLENLLLMLRVEGTLSGLPWALAQALSVCLSVSLCLYRCLSVCLCMSQPVSLCLCLSAHEGKRWVLTVFHLV